MSTRQSFLALITALILATVSQAAIAKDKIKIGFLRGVVDPFYQVMQLGVETAAKDLNIEVVTQVPQT